MAKNQENGCSRLGTKQPEAGKQLLLVDILKPYPAAEMTVYRVSRAVNSPKNNKQELTEPAT